SEKVRTHNLKGRSFKSSPHNHCKTSVNTSFPKIAWLMNSPGNSNEVQVRSIWRNPASAGGPWHCLPVGYFGLARAGAI
ncbi:hypothetical protein, partial [Bradyrhizobium sp.]|uniref:hypothetical protein n=1 Tax=Bradyrhizobium sp. TaxID=376 RepID=UPI0025BE7D9A